MSLVEALHSTRDRIVRRAPVIGPWIAGYYSHRFAREQANYLVYHGVYPDAASARAALPATVPTGFDQEACAKLFLSQTDRILTRDYPVAYWLEHLFANGCRHVFDLGGNIGTKYYALQHYVSFPADLRWTVCELPTIARAGSAWATQHDASGRLRFCTAADEAGEADVLLASGVLQYLDYPLPSLLARLPASPRHILVNVTPLHPAAAFFTLQKHGTIHCSVYRIEDRPGFIRSFERLGYSRQDEWDLPGRSCEIPFYPEYSIDRYYGFLFNLAGV